jgi:thymidylate synthase
MFLPRISQPDCAAAWLEASRTVHALPKHEAHHVVIDVEDPVTMCAAAQAVVGEVDKYLVEHSKTGFLVRTVANTIFPQATYEQHGAPDLYGVYIDKIFPRLKRSPKDWGRYFERMIAFPSKDGSVNLLEDLITKMKRNVEGDTTYRNIYELPIYNPLKDANGSPRGGQCLSFMSFKLDKDRRLLLSAVYRNHYYTEKLLGNLIGLGRLMSFVATEAGTCIGGLSVLSTHAEVDTAGGSRPQLKALHAACAALLGEDAHAAA